MNRSEREPEQRLAGRQESFNQAIKLLRPELYRYCSRMAGSLLDAEDLVQDVLTRAYAVWPDTGITQLRGWLFRIAHHRAIDLYRQIGRQRGRLAELAETAPVLSADPGSRLDQAELATMAFSAFLRLTPVQRSCVILKDVMSYSLEEIAAWLDTSPGAVKSALYRGRRHLHKLAADFDESQSPIALAEAETRLLASYVAHFRARNFEALRRQLLQEVRLDLVEYLQLAGSQDVGQYFTRYDALDDWELSLIHIGPSTAILFSDSRSERSYLILIEWQGDKIARIRDYRYARELSAMLQLTG